MVLGIVPIRWSRSRREPTSRLSVLGRAISTLIALVAVAGCSCSSAGAGKGDGKLTVVAGFYPLAEAARKVGGSLVDVRNLTPPGVEPHDLELTPNTIAAIQSSDVVLYLGHGFAPAIEQAARDAQGEAVDLLDGMPLRQGTSEEGGQGTATDPHVWLDPLLYRRMGDRIAAVLSRTRPDAASTFGAMARSFDGELSSLDRDYREGFSGCARDLIVTSHAAFGYLSARYHLVQQPISGLSPDAEPSPKRLAQLAQLVRREGVTVIFTEELVSPKVAQTLAREVGVTTQVLNPLEGLTKTEVSHGADYLSVMRKNLKILVIALGCQEGGVA
jgi:zinc transport system substrate-binding protein